MHRAGRAPSSEPRALPRTPFAAALGLLLATQAAGLTYENASTGLPADGAYPCGSPGSGSTCGGTGSGWVGVAAGDLDGDGFDDVVAVGRLQAGFRAWLSGGDGTWSEAFDGIDLSDCHGRSDVELADVDGDGDLDFGGIAEINGAATVYLGDGSGGWRESSAGLEGGNGGEGFTFGDFDGDGHVDLAISGHLDVGGTRAWLGDGEGNWSELSTGLPAGGGGHHLAAGDLDLDGRDELIDTLAYGLPAGVTGGVHAWRLGEDGAWKLLWETPSEQPHGVAVGDLDADGDLDLVVATVQDEVGTTGSVRAFLNDGTGVAFTESSAGLPSRVTYESDVVLGDLDNDGDLDVVHGDWDGAITAHLNDGGATWSEATGAGLPTGLDNIEDLAIGDVDGDCLLDVIHAAYTCGVQVHRQAEAPPCPILAEAGPSRRACPGDLKLDASASRLCGCAPGDERYRWWAGDVIVRDWDASPEHDATPDAETLYRVDVACDTDLDCFVSDVVRVIPLPGSVPVVEPAESETCPGEEIVLSVPGAWESVLWSTEPPGQPGDGATTPSIVVAPDVDTTYDVEVVSLAGCAGEASGTVRLADDTVPPAIGPSLRVSRAGVAADSDVVFTWSDLAGAWGDTELVGWRVEQGDPTPPSLDGPEATLLASAPLGVETAAVSLDGLPATSLLFTKVRGTSTCTETPGPTSD